MLLNVNAGVFVGWDHLKDTDQMLYKWEYNKNYVQNIVFSLPIYEFEKLTQQRYDSFRGVKLKTFSAPIRIRGGFGSKDKYTFE